jgi:hypothetical protein
MVKVSRSKSFGRRAPLRRSAAFATAFVTGQIKLGTKSNAMTTQGPFRTLEELGVSLASAGVSAKDQTTLLNMALPAVALQSTAAIDNDIPIGASKIGGAPDLPPNFSWPMRAPTTAGDANLEALHAVLAEMKAQTFAKGYFTEQNYIDGIANIQSELDRKTKLFGELAPLTFVLQLDLEDQATGTSIDPDFPQVGRLLLFYDMVLRPWFARDKDKHPLFQIVHDKTPKAELKRRAAPNLGYPLVEFSKDDPRDVPFLHNHMPSARITPVFTYTLPDNHTQPFFFESILSWKRCATTEME